MSHSLEEIIQRLAGRRIAVVGDVCLDEYVVGRAARLSREAPVPVLEFQRRFTLPGGAANPAFNVSALGGCPTMITAIGDDDAGRALTDQLAENGVDTAGVLVVPGRETTLKTRILAEVGLRFPQQVARVDRQERSPLDVAIVRRLIDAIGQVAADFDAILVSDYQNGVVTSEVTQAVSIIGRQAGRLTTADTQGSLDKFRGFDVVKANQPDTERWLGAEIVGEDGFHRAGVDLLTKLSARAVVITRAGDGLSAIDADGYLRVPAANRTDVFDTTGAGDTVIAVLTQAMAAGASVRDAARLANLAAGLVVRKLGNATVSPEELMAEIRPA